MDASNKFPSMKAERLLRVLESKPLRYRVVRQKGSHRRLKSRHYPSLTVSYHHGATVPPGVVRRILVKDVGLSVQEARGLL